MTLRAKINYYIYYKIPNYFTGQIPFFKYSSRMKIIKKAIGFVDFNDVDGDYLEFGTYSGNTFVHAFTFAQMKNLKSMRFYAFDSFEGLPKPKGIDKEYEQFQEGNYSQSVEEFIKAIMKKGVNPNKVEIVKGFYEDSLTENNKKKLPLKKASIVYVDSDLYSSAVSVLNFITDYLQDGSIIIFDEWFSYKGNTNKGEQRAFREWLERNPQIIVSEYYRIGTCANSFIVHLNGESK